MRPRLCAVMLALSVVLTMFALALSVVLTMFAQGAPATAEGQEPADEEQGFTWIATADHFEEPVEGLIERVVAAKPAFVIGIGDLVFQSRPQDFAVFEKVIIEPLAAVGAKFYPVVGNHDFPLDDRWSTFWPPPTNRLYYSFDYGNSHFVILDTNKAMLDEAWAEGPMRRAVSSTPFKRRPRTSNLGVRSMSGSARTSSRQPRSTSS